MGLVVALGLILLVAMAWQGVSSTDEAARQDVSESLDKVVGRLQILARAAEMTAESAERVMRATTVSGATLRPILENSLAAFEQRPELSYLGLVLPETGEYGNMERTAKGDIFLWLFSSPQAASPDARTFLLKEKGFLPHTTYPTYGYDPRKRPFYKAAIQARPEGTWMPAYQWIEHTSSIEPLWGISYVKALRDGSGKLTGVLDTDLDLPALNRFLNDLATEYGARIYVVELGATPCLIGAAGVQREPASLSPELASVIGFSGETFVDRMKLDGERRWIAARRMTLKGGVPWMIIASRAAPVIETSLSRQLWQILGMGAAIAVGLVLVSLRMARRFARPLVELEQRVADIGRESADASAVHVGSANAFRETQLLGQALDRMATNMGERRHAEQRIRHLALHDSLTGLPNRHLIQERLAQAIVDANRSGRLLALMHLDLDRFKIVNDGYGHSFGNAVLKATGEHLLRFVRETDTVARLSGDEFLILLTDLEQPAAAEIVARQIIESLRTPLVVQERDIHVSVSIGLSVFGHDGETAEVLIEYADIAMYRAKELGRDTYQLFTPAMGQETQRRVDLEIKLRGAVAAGQLQLVYQPKVNLGNGRITGCEALLRWRHPELGTVSPAHFIPIAEDSGLIVPIGDWVLRTACTQARQWMDAGLPPLCTAVNISVRQFLRQDVVDWVAGILQETGLPPECLELELTETLIAQDLERVTTTIDRLKDLGVKLSIDDFGTGYSSLNYLKRFRVDTLKIDQSFVCNMLTEQEDATIVLAVIALAHNLKFKVIAEGVDSAQHCHVLHANHCDEIQGYYFSRPVPAAEFEQMLREDKRLPQT